ncbi:hypothetical protein FQA39_LY04163 [Lamprigera yunnana]|nr:hypothetical protein FQA39_LY04163 [Lamprigera yunnana]
MCDIKMSHYVNGRETNRDNIVEQILEQGQRLRNAMVKSILDNDPFYLDTVNTNTLRHLKKNKAHLQKTNDEVSHQKKSDTKSVQVMSAELPDVYCGCDICNIYKRDVITDRCQHALPLHLLNRTKSSFQNAQFTDVEGEGVDYIGPPPTLSRTNLQCDTNEKNPPREITKRIQNSYRTKAAEYFKYIDSLKITVHNLSLNSAGNKKAVASGVDSKYKLPTTALQSYFVEYTVPECLTHNVSKSNSKVDSGLMSNTFRICSKKLQNEEIYFKHTSVHEITNLQQLDLNSIEIKFQVSSRMMKQKKPNVLGYATFNMRLFEITKDMCYMEYLPILSEDFILGTIKITIQLGCGKLYFGKEFVDFVNNNRKDSVSTVTQKTDLSTIPTPMTSQTATSVIFQNKRKEDEYKFVNRPPKPIKTDKPGTKLMLEGNIINKDKFFDNDGFASSVSTVRSEIKNFAEDNRNYYEDAQQHLVATDNDKVILYGLIYVSEAKYFEGAINSYLSCQAFCLGDTLCSRVVYNSKDPVFNFYQKVPFLYDTSFLNYLRDNSIVIDFWERYDEDDIAIGTAQLSLYQFYVTYRNQIITNTLIQNRLPVTIADWWEPICSPVNGKLYGQMKVLVAIGTATQVQNLEIERGLKDESLSVTYVPIVPEVRNEGGTIKDKEELVSNQGTQKFKRPIHLNQAAKVPIEKKTRDSSTNSTLKSTKTVAKPATPLIIKKSAKTVDIGIQSENMESQNPSEEKVSHNSQNLLEAFLTQLIDQQQKNKLVETATNTENTNLGKSNNENNEELVDANIKDDSVKNATNTGLKKTSDLLDYLNDALGLDNKVLSAQMACSSAEKQSTNSFKAHVLIEGALHLPCRRKCKVKKSKKKNITYEDAMPSTYVTFETTSGTNLKYTSVIPRSTNPQWDYKSDVLLPVDMLVNNQKRLIFKVWRKTNCNSSQPNLQTDVILGFAALDLTVLLAGLPSVQGWFNIIDFSSRCNGQIKIHVTPLENISKYVEYKSTSSQSEEIECKKFVKTVPTARILDVQEPHGELLSRTLKRKFTELEEITQRLRSRLANVTKDDSDTSNDELADEFDRDINTLSIEEDYDMLDLKSLSENTNFQLRSFSQMESDANNFLLKKASCNEDNIEPSLFSKGILHCESFPKGGSNDSAYGSTKNQNVPNSSPAKTVLGSNFSLTTKDKQLLSGKQHIDSLLEKLTLLTGNSDDNAFPSRYISGCSTNQDQPPINVDKTTSSDDQHRGGFNFDTLLNPELFNKLCSSKISTSSVSESESVAGINSDSSSLLTQFVNYRQAPDGAGFATSSSTSSNTFNIKNN